MDQKFQSKLSKPTTTNNSKVNGCKTAIHSTNSQLIKPRTMSGLNQNIQARPTSPKITKRVNSSSLMQTTSNFMQPKMNNITSRIATSQQKSSVIKKPTSTFHSSQSAKPLTINSSANRLMPQTSNSKLSNSRASSSSSIIKGREPKKLVKDTINNSSFVPREKLEKLTKRHEELTNKYNLSSQIVNRSQTAVDALSCLINYMAIDLDAFECPNLKRRINHLEQIEQKLLLDVSNVTAENQKVNSELEFERHRSQKEKENLLEMFEVEMKSVEKNYQDNLKVEQKKRDKAESDLLYLKQNLSKDKKIDFLNKEIESLKTVLELKDAEIKDLRYKIDRTIVDKDEISQLKNECDNLLLANEQLSYSLNMKNEELKFVLNENTSLASLSSLTSTPLNNDRNNNIVKKRKNTTKKQKLDSNEKDEDNFLKPLNLHKDRFVKPPVDMVDNCKVSNDFFDNDDEMNKSLDDKNDLIETNLNHRIDDFVQPLVDEINFVKPLIDRAVDLNFVKSMSVDHDDNLDKEMESSFIKQSMDISLENSLNKSLDKPFKESHNKSLTTSLNPTNKSTSFDRSSFNKSIDNPLDIRKENNENSFTRLIDQKESSSDSIFVKPFDINEIKERCFAKPIDKESPAVKNKILVNSSYVDKQFENNSPKQTHPQIYHQENFIKTCQILNEENEISIIKNKKLEPGSNQSNLIFDSGFAEL